MLQKYDFLTLTLIFILLIVGSLAIFSATSSTETGENGFFLKQLIWVIIGISSMIIISFIPLKALNRYVYWIYGFSIFFLLLVLVIGKTGQGAERWLTLGPINIQPSEIAKVATILAVSKFLADKYADVNKFKYFTVSIILISVPFILVARQPDLGTALVFLALIIPFLYWAGLNWFYIFTIITPVLTMVLSFNFFSFLSLMLIITIVLVLSQKKPIVITAVFLLNIGVGIVTPYLWNQLRPYQQQRILTFINPEKDSKGAGYQIIQSQVAIGSGGVWGKGYLKGSQTHLRFLPAQHTDFIFSVLGEEFGFMGTSFILFVYFLLILRLVNIAASIRQKFESLTIIGITTILVFHILINIGMTIGLAPVTGLPLPFLSYGGSFLVIMLSMMGIVLNISRNKFVR
jgi:rod shape determining protein RodA